MCGNGFGICLNSLLNVAKLVANLLQILPEFISLLGNPMSAVQFCAEGSAETAKCRLVGTHLK
jgi:hypothetical protein